MELQYWHWIIVSQNCSRSDIGELAEYSEEVSKECRL